MHRAGKKRINGKFESKVNEEVLNLDQRFSVLRMLIYEILSHVSIASFSPDKYVRMFVIPVAAQRLLDRVFYVVNECSMAFESVVSLTSVVARRMRTDELSR